MLLFALSLAGTIGFRILTGERWIDCAYQAVITLTTVGSREPANLSDVGKIFVMVYLAGGIGIFTYSAFEIGQILVSNQLRGVLEKRRMQRDIDGLSGHFIVCGLGRMGRTICEYLHERNRPFVVIDDTQEVLDEICPERNWIYVEGDASDDAVLRAAGIDRARSLATALPTDADNVYVVLSARLLSSSIQIIARASDHKAIEKMEKAGANRVISPFSSGAVKMARFMLHPSIEDFIEIADDSGADLEVADLQITPDSPYVGRRIDQTDLRARGVMIIGVRRSDGQRLMPPPGDTVLHAGDSLFAFGSTTAVNRMIGEAEVSSA